MAQCSTPGIGLVVVDRLMATRPDGGNHLVLARVALAGRVLLDRADRHALVRDCRVALAPRREAWPGSRRRRCAASVETWRRTSSKCRQSMPSQDCLISVSHRLKRRKRMPPPSKRCGRKLSDPLVTWPSLPRSAQPVVVPRSRARMVVVDGVRPCSVQADASDGSCRNFPLDARTRTRV